MEYFEDLILSKIPIIICPEEVHRQCLLCACISFVQRNVKTDRFIMMNGIQFYVREDKQSLIYQAPEEKF